MVGIAGLGMLVATDSRLQTLAKPAIRIELNGNGTAQVSLNKPTPQPAAPAEPVTKPTRQTGSAIVEAGGVGRALLLQQMVQAAN